ncbi:MAG: hypothetical protein QN203_07935, partial [Armatimonadota bacterium]|nr:hypothetical protein [Armatimonadota bacterium]
MTFEELLRQADGYRQAGRAGQAQALLARAAAIAAPKAPAQAAELFEDAGRLAARAGAHERAAESYRQALRLARQADAPPAVLARLYAGLARAC